MYGSNPKQSHAASRIVRAASVDHGSTGLYVDHMPLAGGCETWLADAFEHAHIKQRFKIKRQPQLWILGMGVDFNEELGKIALSQPA